MTNQSNNRRRQGRIAALAVLAGPAFVSAPHFAAAAPNPLALIQASPQTVVSSGSLTLTASIHSQVLEGQPAELVMTVYNSGPKELIIGGSAFEASSFDFTLTDEKGHAVPRTAQGGYSLTPPMSCANSTVNIKPDQTLRYSFNLARLFDLSRPGTYTVSAGRIFAPWLFGMNAPNPGTHLSPTETSLTTGPLKFRMEETADTKSGPVAYVPLPDHQTFLYMASIYGPGITRCRVEANGRVSYAYHPSAKASTPPAPSVLGTGSDYLAVTPDGRFLYAETRSANIISQYKIGDDGVLSPLIPPTVPLPVETDTTPRPLLMAADGRFLYSETGAFYAMGPDGWLTLKGTVFRGDLPPDKPLSALRNASGIDPKVTFLDGWNRYHIDFNGELLSDAGFDYGTPIVTQTEPVLRWGAVQLIYAKEYSSFEFKPWAVDPSSHFLVVLRQNVLECYRIEGRKLTLLNKLETIGYLKSAFFIPGSPLVYATTSNDLLVFGLDSKQGLIATDMPAESYIPLNISIISASAPTPPVWGKTTGGLAISVHLPADILPAIQPVVLTVTLQNTTTKPLSLGTVGADMSAFRLSLTGPPHQRFFMLPPDNRPLDNAIPLFAAGRDLLGTPHQDNTPLILPPGEKRQYRFVLSRLADLTVSGAYTVQVTRTLPNGKTAASPIVPLVLSDPSPTSHNAESSWTRQVPS